MSHELTAAMSHESMILARHVIRRQGNNITIEGPFGQTVSVSIERFETEVARLASKHGMPVLMDRATQTIRAKD